MRILLDYDVDVEKIRNEVIRMLGGRAVYPDPQPTVLFEAESPPLAPEVVAEIARVRQEKEEALAAQDFERAARARDRERQLVYASRRLTHAWRGEPDPIGTPIVPRLTRQPGRSAAVAVRAHRVWHVEPLLAGWAMFGIASGVGLLVGWLIWG